MLAETRAELDDFHHASKELEAELENELSRTEKAQRDLKVKVDRAETEKDEWKVCLLWPDPWTFDSSLPSVEVHVPAVPSQHHDNLFTTRT